MKKNRFESYILKNTSFKDSTFRFESYILKNNSFKHSTFRFEELRFEKNNELGHHFLDDWVGEGEEVFRVLQK